MWGLKDIPRSMQEQIVRTRRAAFFCEGHRIVDKSHFADDGSYFPLPKEYGTTAEIIYHNAMRGAQANYKSLLKEGVPREIARGVLPMHVGSRLVMMIHLREFARMISLRTCHIAQGSYWTPLIACFEKELRAYFSSAGDYDGKITEYIFRPPCASTKVCITPKEAENRRSGKDIFPPCPLYTEEIRANSTK